MLTRRCQTGTGDLDRREDLDCYRTPGWHGIYLVGKTSNKLLKKGRVPEGTSVGVIELDWPDTPITVK